MNKTDMILRRFSDVKDIIDSTQETIKSGHTPDITHIEQIVDSLCRESLALPRDESVKIKPVMAEMIEKLNQLETDLKQIK